MARFLPDKELNMRKSWINTVLIIVLCMLLASCKSPEKANQPKTDNPDVSVTDKNTDEVKKEESKTPAPEMLEGEWILGSGMIEGEEYTAEDAGYTTEVTFEKTDDGIKAHYWREMNGLRQEFDASLEILDTPVYEGCGNDEWSATFVTDNEFSDKDEFYMTLIGEDKLLIKHIYIIDHYDESMGMSYAFYDRK